jgi:predicted Fe-Mo cluster-binding NifX family protein
VDPIMSTLVAFPTEAPGGLDAMLAQHFGHSPTFTLVTLGENGVEATEVVAGVPHEHGGCMAPVALLAKHGVRAFVAGGIGRGPLMGFTNLGIEVLHNDGAETVGEAVFAYLAGRLPRFAVDAACGEHHH